MGSALRPPPSFEFVGARHAVPAIAAKLRIVARDARKFFTDIMHGRVDCAEMIRRHRATQEMMGNQGAAGEGLARRSTALDFSAAATWVPGTCLKARTPAVAAANSLRKRPGSQI